MARRNNPGNNPSSYWTTSRKAVFNQNVIELLQCAHPPLFVTDFCTEGNRYARVNATVCPLAKVIWLVLYCTSVTFHVGLHQLMSKYQCKLIRLQRISDHANLIRYHFVISVCLSRVVTVSWLLAVPMKRIGGRTPGSSSRTINLGLPAVRLSNNCLNYANMTWAPEFCFFSRNVRSRQCDFP